MGGIYFKNMTGSSLVWTNIEYPGYNGVLNNEDEVHDDCTAPWNPTWRYRFDLQGTNISLTMGFDVAGGLCYAKHFNITRNGNDLVLQLVIDPPHQAQILVNPPPENEGIRERLIHIRNEWIRMNLGIGVAAVVGGSVVASSDNLDTQRVVGTSMLMFGSGIVANRLAPKMGEFIRNIGEGARDLPQALRAFRICNIL